MKLLKGYVKNRTKEAALAAVLLALFFVVRTYKMTIIPGVLILDFSAAVIYSAVSILSWPYTLVFSLSTLYGGSNVFACVAFIVGSQVVFFLSKLAKEEWVSHTPVFGQVSILVYGLLLHFTGGMNLGVFFTLFALPLTVSLFTTYFGGLMFWKIIRRFGVID